MPRLTKMMQGLPLLVGASRKRFIGTVSQLFHSLTCAPPSPLVPYVTYI